MPSRWVRSSAPQPMSTRLMSASGTRKCSQNCRYASQGAPSFRGSNESVSMKTGRPPLELDVVRARVAQGEAAVQRALLELEREQRRVLELAERPLVGIGDEVGPARAGARPPRRRVAARSRATVSWGTSSRCRASSSYSPERGDGLEFVLEDAVDLAVEDARAGVDEPAGVAERAV